MVSINGPVLPVPSLIEIDTVPELPSLGEKKPEYVIVLLVTMVKGWYKSPLPLISK